MTTEAQPAEEQAGQSNLSPAGARRWLAVGTGVGIEIRESELHATIVRIRPSEASILGAATVTDYRARPAAEWGAELSGFLKKLGAGHIAAAVLLPRSDVIVRVLHLPGVAKKDLESAIRLQVDTLHPFAEDDVYFSWSPLDASGHVLVGIARREIVQRYSSLFAEAGIKIGSFTFSAAALYSAMRLITAPPAGFAAVQSREVEVEAYGESESKPVFSSTFPTSPERAAAVAQAELRLPADAQPLTFADLLPRPAAFPDNYDPATGAMERNALPYATALMDACPWLSLQANLLPMELRRASSRLRLIPTFVLAGTLAVLLTLLALHSTWSDRRYLAVLQHEIRKLEPAVRRVESADKQIAVVRLRTQLLDDFRRRSKQDMDALNEITKLIPPPGWVSSMEMDRTTIQIGGEMEQAATLLKSFDSSPLFENSEFTMPIVRGPNGEMFRVRIRRQQTPANPPPADAPSPGPPAAASGESK